MLNAFRHRRSVRDCLTIAQYLDLKVLNAFRHRRSVRNAKGVRIDTMAECSTPFGIGDRCGW
ncbi:uncharacterized protein Dmul_04130 [Desulfococcus multivorans]|nr:uncharacterized protein Dmul_04130 [Desulfococcus multivorans]